MTMKTVNIEISDSALETLKQDGYKMCFAKKVNDTFDVVWQSYNEYLSNNSFSWTPVYQLFGSNTFQGNLTVNVSTNCVNIGLGEESTLDSSGVLGDAVTGGPSTGFTMINNYGSIHPGVNQLSIGIDGTQSTTPIYVAEKPIVTGQDLLTPIDEVMVWFQQDIETSTMISTAVSNGVVIDLTETNSATRLYDGSNWSTPSSAAMSRDLAGPLILKVIVYATTAIVVQDLASKIASKLTGVYKDINVTVQNGEHNTVQVSYKEKSNLAAAQRRFMEVLKDKTLSDKLMEFTAEGLAQVGAGFSNMDAVSYL